MFALSARKFHSLFTLPLLLPLLLLASPKVSDNSPPVAGDDSYTVHGNTNIGPLLANDTDPDGDPISVNAFITTPQHGLLFNGSPADVFNYRPTLGYTGPDSFVYKVCDNQGACANATVSIQVNNAAPVARDDSYAVHGRTRIGPLLANDSDPDGDPIPLVWIITSCQHCSGLANTEAPDSFYYTPAYGFTGSDSLTYRVCDNLGACSNANVTLMVLANDGAENCGTGSCNTRVGEPVNVTNGNMYLQQSDYSLPGVGPSTNITRTYNSISQNGGLFGKGWSTDYDESVKVYSSTYVRWFRADGRATNFMRSSGAEPFTSVESDFHGSMVQNGDGTFTVTFIDASVHRFSSTGKLLSLADRMNNQSFLTYDINGKLISITDPFGRVLAVTPDANGRVNSISDSLSAAASYTYGASGELLTVN
jgi:YD repeat-containing protein